MVLFLIRKARQKFASKLKGVAKKRAKSKRYRNQKLLNALGDHVRKCRIKKGYSIDRLSKEAEQLSPAAIHRVENGQSDCQVSVLYRIADVLEIPLRDLFSFDVSED